MSDETSLPAAVATLGSWSPWQPFTPDVVRQAPVSPGVYCFQQNGALVYVGRAGERSGKGLKGRLTIYVSGRAPHSGLGNLALERALQDAGWLRERIEEVEAGTTRTVQQWSRLAVERAALSICWSTTTTTEEGAALERAVLDALKSEALWNRLR